MKFYITAHPIDKPHQLKIGIYQSGYVNSHSVGRVLRELVKRGHRNIHSYEEDGTIYMHCSVKEGEELMWKNKEKKEDKK